MANKELKAQVGSLEATVAENKNKVEQADELLNHSIDIRTKLREKHDKIVEVEDAHKNAEELLNQTLRSWRTLSRLCLLICEMLRLLWTLSLRRLAQWQLINCWRLTQQLFRHG